MRQIKHVFFILFIFLSLGTVSHATPAPEAEVFKLTPKVTDPNTLLLTWQIKEGNFLYKKRFSFKTSQAQTLGPVRLPSTDVIKKYSEDKTYQVYRNSVAIPLSLLNHSKGKFKIIVSHQGCADSGFCYPPTKDTVEVKVNQDLEMTSAKIVPNQSSNQKKPSPLSTDNNSTPYQTLFEDHNIAYIIISFFGFGLLLAFTPCVLPMVPVLSSIIVGHQNKANPKTSLLLSISYVLGMSVTYALIGIIIALIGQNLQVLFQSPITISIFAIIFVLLALAMFDFYDLRLPQSLQSKIATKSREQNTGAYFGAAMMGALSILILSPCVTAPLVGALSYIAQTSNMAIGGTALFFLGLGMGTPLILIGTSAGQLLPKAGNWMNHIKHAFGVMLLIIAISLAERVFPAAITMLAWSALLIISAIFLGIFEKNLATNGQKFAKGIAILLFAYGLLILIGTSMGNSSPYFPLKSLSPTPSLNASSIATTTVKPSPMIVTNLNDAQTIIQKARQQHQKVLIDFYADWCASCKEMDESIFSDPKVQAELMNLVWLKVDLTKRNTDSIDIEKNFKIVAPPTMIFLSNTGKEMARIIGETTKKQFLKTLNK
jgi:thiol:disulfide interchange protein DsbD